MNGIELISLERIQQKTKHGFTPEKDARYTNNQLFFAAVCFHYEDAAMYPEDWDTDVFDKIVRKTRAQQLAIAGALYMAEDDRTGGGLCQPYIHECAKMIDNILSWGHE
jgi:hypothetical protein